jgi:hypothetical protein
MAKTAVTAAMAAAAVTMTMTAMKEKLQPLQ